jgi:hypothetical protein
VQPYFEKADDGASPTSPSGTHAPVLKDCGEVNSDKAETDENIEAWIKEKYFYAGASARWMFAEKILQIKELILEKVNRVSNIKNLLDNFQGSELKDNPNHLLMTYPGREKQLNFFVSQYALKLLLEHSNDISCVKHAYNFALLFSNPSFLGWVVEFDFIHKLYQSSTQ